MNTFDDERFATLEQEIDQLTKQAGLTDAQGNVLGFALAHAVAERMRQHIKWGEQNWPDFPPGLAGPSVNHYYGLPSEEDAKAACQGHFARREGTYGDILLEEVAEAFSAPTPPLLRGELIQVAAVALAWVEKLDREAEATTPAEVAA